MLSPLLLLITYYSLPISSESRLPAK